MSSLDRMPYCLAKINSAAAALLEAISEDETVDTHRDDISATITMLWTVITKLAARKPAWRTKERDAELAAILESTTAQLRDVEALRGAERDAAYARVEAFAAPYAIAFYYEIAALDSCLNAVRRPAGDATLTPPADA